MPHQPELMPPDPAPEQAARNAERAHYLAWLAEKLKEPAFRAIEGFPLAEDEAILALSDPPFYTACPNPFLPEIIERWQQERAGAQGHSEEKDNPKSKIQNPKSYHREPFAADVSEGKNDPIYNAHSYHTKVPHKAIMRYILHYTEPGDLVFDGFCGTGMTGVAAQLCADKKTVESLGYFVDDAGNIYETPPKKDNPKSKIQNPKSSPRPPAPPLPISKLGARKAILCDLSPAATFIAYNYNTPVEVTAFEKEARRILAEVEAECGWMYETLHTDGKTKGRINYTVWSDVFMCPECGEEMILWEQSVDIKNNKVRKDWPCPKCSVLLARTNSRKSGALGVELAMETIYDQSLDQTIQRAKQKPVRISYTVGRSRYEKNPDVNDLNLIRRIAETSVNYQSPKNRMPAGDEARRNDRAGITHVHHFYTQRNLSILVELKHLIAASPKSALFQPLLFTLTSGLDRVSIRNSYRPQHRNNKSRELGGPMPGTLYVPKLYAEINPMLHLGSRIGAVSRLFNKLRKNSDFIISTQGTANINIPDNSVDYIFIDPPFGANLMYSELNFIMESWLQVRTRNDPEAIINNTQEKDFTQYQNLMEQCFSRMFSVLRAGRWITVEFHNSQNSVWNAIQEALSRVGFVIADVRSLGKNLATLTQLNNANAVKQDLIISAYKPRTEFEQQFLAEGGREKGAWEFVRQHLEQLPVVVERPSASALEVVAERQAYLLYDRMVAFHIQRGFSVPLSAAEFYAGLRQKFPERDGMYFLSPQAAEYDKRRLQVQRVEQLALFVTDEKSAIQWLQRELDPSTGSGSQTYQDLQPKFLRELHQARHEKLPELRDILEENFLQDEQERWFLPNPERLEHLEQLRERALLREFQEYGTGGKGRLKVFRTEAVRAGFKRAWADKQYQLIVQVAQRLPDSVLQEDPGLLMYYDNALMRAEQEPRQGRLI